MRVVRSQFSKRVTAVLQTVGAVLLLCLPGLGGCSVQHIAANGVADALAGTGDVFASDNDPELIRDAAPFSLKLMESVLADVPTHRPLLTTTASSFTQYAYAFLIQDADRLETTDIAAARDLRNQARKLLIRGRDYGLRALDLAHAGFSKKLRKNPREVVRLARKSDVPQLYWTAAAWGAAITISKDDPDLIADQVYVEALIDRALELDESYDHGAIHSFLISYESARQGAAGTPESRARFHFQRAVELSGGQMAAPYVALAEAVSIQNQNRAEFQKLLNEAIAINVDAKPQWRLANLIMQRRAKWLLSRTSELFLE